MGFALVLIAVLYRCHFTSTVFAAENHPVNVLEESSSNFNFRFLIEHVYVL